MSVFYTGLLNCRGILQADEILYSFAELAVSNITLPAGVWSDINTLTGIAVGKPMTYQNVGATALIANQADTQPAPGQLDGFVAQQYEYRYISHSGKRLWVRPQNGSGVIVVEEA